MKARGRSEEPQGAGGHGRRDSSVSSLGSGVRCACQFYQSDSLLPERSALQRPPSRPPSRSSATVMAARAATPPAAAAASGEHLYEPISPPEDVVKLTVAAKSVVAAEMTDVNMADAVADNGELVKEKRSREGSADSQKRRFLRAPLDDSLVVPDDGGDEDVAMEGPQLGDSPHGAEGGGGGGGGVSITVATTDEEEGRRFLATPTPTTTTESRTDCDINTSQLDSSGLEDLPLQRGARKRIATAEAEGTQLGFQQRIRSQAGRLRTKLRSMSRPKFSMPERPRFSMPERARFHLPERPKFNLPDRPKFNLPDRPKFSLPERPKFSMPDRPRFHLPQRPRFSMPGSAAKENDEGNKGTKEKKKKPTSSVRRPLRDRASTVSTASSAGGHKRLFDFDFRTYPRIFDRAKRSRDYATSSPKAGPRQLTPPPQQVRVPPARKKGPVGQRWLHRFTDIKYADEEDQEQQQVTAEDEEEGGPPGERGRQPPHTHRLSGDDDELDDEEEPRTESTAPFRDKDYGYAISLEQRAAAPGGSRASPRGEEAASAGDSDREQRSSGSSSDRRRAGVLEEIDSDEFFLRQKGLSQEDVDVGRYLTSEIRDAFRSPANALTRLDSDELAAQYRATPDREPARPVRTRSLQRPARRRRSPTPPSEVADQPDFGTFPPARPKRNRRALLQKQQAEQQAEQQNIEADDAIFIPLTGDEEGGSKIEEGAEDEVIPPPPPPAPTFKLTRPQESVETQQSDEPRSWAMEVEEEQPLPQPLEPPQPPKRKRRSRRDLNDIPSGDVARYANDDITGRERSASHHSNEDIAETAVKAESRYANGDFATESERYATGEQPSIRRYANEDLVARADEVAYVNGGVELLAGEDRRHSADAHFPPLVNGHYSKEDWLDSVQTTKDEVAQRLEPDYIIPGEPPVAPRRSRRRGGDGSSRGTSLADEERTSRGADSLPSEPEAEEPEPGYAAVPARPRPPGRRHKRPARPPPRRRSVPATGRFFSLPRRAIRAVPPVRPVRNYSTLGPSRPPRKSRQQQQQQSEQYVEIDEAVEQQVFSTSPIVDESAATATKVATHADEVIEWMRDRPLPPPPRPPRKHRETEESHELPDSMAEAARMEAEVEAPLVATLREDEVPIDRAMGRTEDEEMPQAEESSVAEEASVATQTDPLPDDVCVEPASEEPPPVYTDASTETEAKEVEEKQEWLEYQRPNVPEISEESAQLKAEQEASRISAEPTVQATEATAPPQAVPTGIHQPAPEPIVIEKPVPFYVMPDADTEVELKARRLEVSELDVGRLTVGELQARKMVVSDVDSVSLQAAEFGSKATHLAVSTLELPSGLLQELRDSLQPHPSPETASQEQVQSKPVETALPQQAELRPMSQSPATSPTPSSVRTRHRALESEEEEEQEAVASVVAPSVPSRRRRHLTRTYVRHTSSDEEELELSVSRPMSRARSRTAFGTAGNEIGALELGRQLVAACQTAAAQALQQCVQYACSVANVDSEGRRRELQAVLCGLLVAVAALVLFGFGSGKTFHYHHWDYIFPPPGP